MSREFYPPQELIELLQSLYATLYRGVYDIMDYRKVIRRNRFNQLAIKIGAFLPFAEFNLNEPVYIRVENNEIVIRQDGKGAKRKILQSKWCKGDHKLLSITEFLRAIGLEGGDWALVKVKKGEMRISNPKIEKQKLETYIRSIRREEHV